MTTPSGPITVEITTGEPGIIEVFQTPAPGLALSTAGPQGKPGTRILSTVGQPSDSLGFAGEYALDVGTSRLYGPKTTTWPIWSEIAPLTEEGWSFAGAAGLTGDDVYLTHAAGGFGGGAVWHNSLQSSNLDVSFQMEMSGGSGADGVTFAFANMGTPTTFVGAGGGDLGLVGTAAVAVAFDTASGSRARIITTTGSSMATVETYGNPLDFRSAPVNVRIRYDGEKLYCWIDDVEIFNRYIVIDANVRIGWTGANGGSTDNHIIRLSSFLPSGGLNLKGERGEVGPVGPAGASAYQLAVANGFSGTEAQWLDSLDFDGVLSGLSDVDPTAPTDGQALTYDSSISKWKPKTPYIDPTTAKGDIPVRNSTGITKQTVGTNGQVLTADSAQGTGLKWATPPTGIPAGGTPGQFLKKNSATDGDVAWTDLSSSSPLTVVASVFGNTSPATVPAGVLATDYAIMVNASAGAIPTPPAGFTLIGQQSGGAVYGNGLNVAYRTGLVAGNTVTPVGASWGIVFVRNMTGPPTNIQNVQNTNGAMPAIPARTLNLGEMQMTFISQTGGPGNPGAPSIPAGWVQDGTQLEGSPNFYSRATIAHSTAGAGGTFSMSNTGVGRSYTVTLPGQLAADSPYALYQAKDVTTETPNDKDYLGWDTSVSSWKPMMGPKTVADKFKGGFSASTVYTSGDIVVINNALWVDTTGHAAGAWTGTGWTKLADFNVRSLFRGEWAAAEVTALSLSLASGKPSVMTDIIADSGVAPIWSATSLFGSAPASPGFVRSQIGKDQTTDISGMQLNLANLGIPGITKVSFWTAASGVSDGRQKVVVNKNGTAALTRNVVSAGLPWQQNNITASSTDVLQFLLAGQGVNAFDTGRMEFAGVDVYASPAYMAGQYVIYNGKLYRSAIDSNASVPGADANWVFVPGHSLLLNAQVGTTYTLALADVNQRVTMTNASASVFTIPTNATTAIPVGATAEIINLGAGAVTVTPASGVTLNKDSGLASFDLAQYQRGTILKTATDTWVFLR